MKHKFKKGKSGNPRGRPRGAKGKHSAELDAILDENVDFVKLIKALAKAAYGTAKKAPNDRCAKILIEHRFGKAKERVELSADKTFEDFLKDMSR